MLRKAEKQVARAVEQLAKFTDTSIVIGAFASPTRHTRGKFAGQLTRSLTATVREKVYGGTGSITDTPHGTVLRLHNREPHAKIVEHNLGVVAAAQVASRHTGLRKIDSKWAETVLAKAGFLTTQTHKLGE